MRIQELSNLYKPNFIDIDTEEITSKKFERLEALASKKLYIWGAGSLEEKCVNELVNYQIKIYGIVDNDKNNGLRKFTI